MTYEVWSGRRVNARPADDANILGALQADDTRVSVRYVRAARPRSVPARGLRRFEPESCEHHIGVGRHLRDRVPIALTSVYRIHDHAVAAADDDIRTRRQRCVNLL